MGEGADSKLGAGRRGVRDAGDDVTPADPGEDDRLLDLLAEWEEQYCLGHDAGPDSLGVDDPALREALRRRIAIQKRLYHFLGPAPLDGAPDGGDRPEASPGRGLGISSGCPEPGSGPAASEDGAMRIGRYQVLRKLGEGGFGRVYLAHDPELQRDVAIKVPIAGGASRFLDVEAYLQEARIVARLSHPHIVPVYDVGQTDDGRRYVVSKYMEGGDLKARLEQGRRSYLESAEMVAVLCDALQYTHTQDLFHRDVKPANILLDADGTPSLADFGLALRDEDIGRGAGYLGTAAYMSPEQARGEGHRVDGRSDIFSVGVVLYELLAGRRPFRGRTNLEIMEQVAQAEPRPPRQIDGTIPGELERICLKALAKRASERYSTARDMADDLRHFLATVSWGAPTAELSSDAASPREPSRPAARGDSDPGSPPIRIVPKGLGSFDEDDADFFLELLPGPRDRDGLPDSLRFWKARIESDDPERAFRVGLIYGPSGCGKSSMVKAGLLPRLGRQVVPIYVESTAGETGARLLRGVSKLIPDLPVGAGLVGALTILRRWHPAFPGRKVLLVLDQFEQWLFARGGQEGTELVAALRQCDGEHLQALCLLRDDFWMAATRFARDLEIDLVPDRNIAAVDLFDPRHARKVLAAYGRAYEALPTDGVLTREHDTFLRQSVAGLAQDDRVVPVRLALFAEMIKGRPWAPATLRELGGMDGVGVRFLEDAFGSARSNPKHRYHQKAAQAVLKALLPESKADIKGRMRPLEELQEACGYASRPGDFADVIRILDHDLRLITPVDAEGPADDEAAGGSLRGRSYQLTHDYLVHALQAWLTRKQRETRRGRAELRLAECSAMWNDRPENRYLPSASEWAIIRLFTRPGGWTEPERRMMRAAAGRQAIRGTLLAILLTIAIVVGLQVRGWLRERERAAHAEGLVSQLLVAGIDQVPRLVRAIDGARDRTYPKLAAIGGDPGRSDAERFRIAVALLPADRAQLDSLLDRLLVATPEELLVIADRLRLVRDLAIGPLWSRLGTPDAARPQRFRAACALAALDPSSDRWRQAAPAVADGLVKEGPLHLEKWLDALRPVRRALLDPLGVVARDPARTQIERSLAVTVLTDYAADRVDLLAQLIQEVDPLSFDQILPVLARHRDRAIALLGQAIDRTAGPDWKDVPPDPAWVEVERSLVDRVERAGGAIGERFAFCQALALEQFPALAEGLRRSGYRPTRVRPYAADGSNRVAAIWSRDGRPWQLCLGSRAVDVHEQDRRWRDRGYEPVDIAAYAPDAAMGDIQDPVFAVVWAGAESVGSAREARLFAGVAEATAIDDEALRQEGLRCIALHRAIGRDGRPSYSAIYRRSDAPVTIDLEGDILAFEARFAWKAWPVDISFGPPPPSGTRAEWQARIDRARESLKVRPDDSRARQAEVDALYRLGRYEEAVAATSAWLAAKPDQPRAYFHRALAEARLGAAEAARADAARFSELSSEPSSVTTFLEAMVATYSGRAREGLERLEATLPEHATHAECLYLYGRAYAAAAGRDRKGREYTDRAVALLKDAISQGFRDYGSVRTDPELGILGEHPGLRRLFGPPGPEVRYTAAWSQDAAIEAEEAHGLAPEALRSACRDWAAQGYRPLAIGVAQPKAGDPPVAATVWYRPAVPDGAHDDLARRGSRAAAARTRLGDGQGIWSLLRHTPDPTRRTYLIHDLGPLGIEPRMVIERLDAEPDASARRALLLALGEFPETRLRPEGREALVPGLLALYRRDPDAGVHGCAGWLLRRWGRADDVRRVDADLAAEAVRGDRDWYVNAAGQTFSIVRGPVEYAMGSSLREPHPEAQEIPHRVRIGRSFAVAATEVTAGLYARFLRDHPEFRRDDSPRHQIGPDGPIENIKVFDAAAFCRWLGEQDRIPEDQQCYPPLPEILRAEREGRLPLNAGYLDRIGYRLPTEAEWEYCGRAMSQVSRPFGRSIAMLPQYGWSTLSSGERTHPVGELKPNELGLFDLLGNVWEWCQDDGRSYHPGFGGRPVDDDEPLLAISERTPLMVRGGSCYYPATATRSATRLAWPLTTREDSVGFRIVRTIR